MASLAARHAASSLRFARPTNVSCSRRAIHLTPVVQKKKATVEIEDLFSEEVAEDLIKAEPTPQTKSSGVVKASGSTSKPAETVKVSKRRRLSDKSRVARFNQICEFITPRLGRKPVVKMPMVRRSAWVQLVQLATTEEQLTKITDMFPGWKESGNQFDAAFSEFFVRRCEELSCPLLALKVYGDYAKYNLPLSLPAARQLLHALHVKHPIDSVMTAAALYDVYQLPAVSEDLVSCSMLMSACFKHNSKDSLKVANALAPQLEELLKHEKPRMEKVEGPVTSPTQKPAVWMKWALKKVDKALFVQKGDRVDWLSVWREKSGHITAAGKF
ncbi:hypothetical protein D9615_004823 [Tricholomella constricta]|uniref:Uncharacterized protein n=1 Tax=Tricholomella constricta TaxID=117010 RepID=A0A8H5M6I1_9AGAR|nr:hypothetical protein D9615_004823 [Tricholomella constricta]